MIKGLGQNKGTATVGDVMIWSVPLSIPETTVKKRANVSAVTSFLAMSATGTEGLLASPPTIITPKQPASVMSVPDVREDEEGVQTK
jgi:hypothetical protein